MSLFPAAALVLLAVFITSVAVKTAEAEAPRAEIEQAPVHADGLCAYVNNNSEWLLPPKYAAADLFSKDGLAWVVTTDNWTKAEDKGADGPDGAPLYIGRTRDLLFLILRDI